MATVTLDRIWLHLASDPDTHLTIRQATWPESFTVSAEVRRFAGGVKRIISRPGSTVSVTVGAPMVAIADWRTLKTTFAGVAVLMRDGRGFREWGLISDVQGTPERAVQVMRDVAFTFTSITWSEVV